MGQRPLAQQGEFLTPPRRIAEGVTVLGVQPNGNMLEVVAELRGSGPPLVVSYVVPWLVLEVRGGRNRAVLAENWQVLDDAACQGVLAEGLWTVYGALNFERMLRNGAFSA